MALKQKKKRNPVYQKGYETGFNEGKMALVDLIADRLEQLKDVDGIGSKTWSKIEDVLEGVDDESH